MPDILSVSPLTPLALELRWKGQGVLVRKVILVSLIISGALVSGCGNNADDAAGTEFSLAPVPTAPVPTGTANIIDTDVAKQYRASLEKSLAAQNQSGITEIWSDPDGNIAQVVAFDVSKSFAVQHDIIADEATQLESDAMMPTVLLDELDALEGNASTDVGSVSSQKAGTYTVMNHIDDSQYVTVYTIDDQNRISSAKVYVDDELSASAKFVYGLTDEGTAAYAKLK